MGGHSSQRHWSYTDQNDVYRLALITAAGLLVSRYLTVVRYLLIVGTVYGVNPLTPTVAIWVHMGVKGLSK